MEDMRWRKCTHELTDSFLFLEDVIKDKHKTTYTLKWTLLAHSRILMRTTYNCHYVYIGKTLHRFRIRKQEINGDSETKSKRLLIGLTPTPTCSDVLFSIFGKSGRIGPQNRNVEALGYVPDEKCNFEFAESDFSMYQDLTALCKITVDTNHDYNWVRIENGSKILDDFEHLYDSGLYWDVTVCVGDKQFHVHNYILSIRSSVFAAMFQHKTIEQSERKVVIEDSNETAVGEFLRFLYCGKMNPLTTDLALGLLHLSDKYDVPELKSMAADYLCWEMSSENVLRILVTADGHGESFLKYRACIYITENFGKIMKTPEWEMFRSHLDLVDDLLRYYIAGVHRTDLHAI